tara:strand:- start:99 stop:440 length:342 start_codon:yes stop_codon:yes gene_type:complete
MDRGSYRSFLMTEKMMGKDFEFTLGNIVKYFFVSILNDWRLPSYYVAVYSVLIGIISSIILIYNVGFFKGLLFGYVIAQWLTPFILKIFNTIWFIIIYPYVVFRVWKEELKNK